MAEAVPDRPDAAVLARFFGDRAPLLLRYADMLRTDGVAHGLLGPREVPRLYGRHLLNSVAVAPLVPAGAQVCDVGSGAGLPGVVLAIARPDCRVTLLEPLLRRATFLDRVREELGLTTVTVLRGRAEEQRPGAYDVVTARAVAPLDRLAGWCLPLIRPGGELLALKGANAAGELDDAAPVLRRLGATGWTLDEVGVAELADTTTVIRVRAGRAPARATGRTATRRRRR